MELRDMTEAAARAGKDQKDVGVELYAVQHRLLTMQKQLSAAHTNANLIADIRKKAEADLTRFREVRVLCTFRGRDRPVATSVWA